MFSVENFFFKILIIITCKTKSDFFLICNCDLIKKAFFCMSKCNYKIKKMTLWGIISFPSKMVHTIFCIVFYF